MAPSRSAMATALVRVLASSFAIDRCTCHSTVLSERVRISPISMTDFPAAIQVSISRSPTPKQKFEEVMLASKLPSDWINLYMKKAYGEEDPSQRHSKRVVRPYDWKDAPYDPEREPRALEVVHRASDFGIGTGFVVPIPGSAGNIGN